MNDDPQPVTPANLRFLRLLVAALAGTMIFGLLVLIALFVIRFPQAPTGAVELPEQISLPAGTQARAFTQGEDWYAVVTSDQRILIYARSDNRLLKEITITTEK